MKIPKSNEITVDEKKPSSNLESKLGVVTTSVDGAAAISLERKKLGGMRIC